MNIAIVGATGLVGRKIIKLCEEFFDTSVEFQLFASKTSEGKILSVNDKDLPIKELNIRNIEPCDIALFSAGGVRSKEYANEFVDRGAFVIDNSSTFRMNDDIPLVVYGINENTINEKTKIIAVTHISNVTGAILPIKEITELAHSKNIPVLVDGCQGAPHLKLDMQDLDCDFYAISCHKMYGPTGLGVLYGKKKWLEQLPPY